MKKAKIIKIIAVILIYGIASGLAQRIGRL
jgi:hypothetical protein